eukprot:293961_1
MAMNWHWFFMVVLVLGDFQNEIDIYFKRDDWFNADNFVSTNAHHLNEEQIVHQKCITESSCYCSYHGNQHYINLEMPKVKVFLCDGDTHNIDYTAHLDFGDYESMLFDMDEIDDMVHYDLRFQEERANRDLTIPLTVRYDWGPPERGVAPHGACPMTWTHNHIIPHSLLRRFWNTLITTDLGEFRRLAGAVATALLTKAGDPQWNMPGGADAYRDAANALNIALGNAAFTYNSGDPIAGWAQIKAYYEWMPGDIFGGPSAQLRSDDPGSGFEEKSEQILRFITGADTVYNALRAAYVSMNRRPLVPVEIAPAVTALIQHGINGNYIPFNPRHWEIHQTGGQWKYRIKAVITRRRRRLTSNELNIYEYSDIIIDKNDWFDTAKWTNSNSFSSDDGGDVHQKCRGKECYCRINGKQHKMYNDFVYTQLCTVTDNENTDRNNVASANAMMDNDLTIRGAGRAGKWSNIFDFPPTVDWGRYCLIQVHGARIIPWTTIRDYYNTLLVNRKTKTLKELTDKFDIANTMRWISNNLRDQHRGGQDPVASYHKLERNMAWIKGNVFVAPVALIRFDEPAPNTFDVNAAKVILHSDVLRDIYDSMTQYIGGTAFTDDALKVITSKLVWGAWRVPMTLFYSEQWEVHQDKWRAKDQ